ncbi:FAD-dependent oxidoreductase [Occultella glacieicola]|uniref:FAD-dependent oxidoreductase n=1 Tax=Occultella glacieicola TaxID=2518684 RepID=UPI0014054887|nr:FAD-dependent oxidoreductase [Occultella glacieicola]
MAEQLATSHHDIVIVGGGAAGVAAAIAARRSGLDTVLIEAGPFFGGELVSGLPIDGCLNARGEWIVGGVARQLFDAVESAGSFARAMSDYRQMWAVCVDPEMLKMSIIEALAEARVNPRLYLTSQDVVVRRNRVEGIIAVGKGKRYLITGDVFIDCTGDGQLAVSAGAPFEFGGRAGELQPVSLTYRLTNVDYSKYLDWVAAEPDLFLLAENPALGYAGKREAARAARDGGFPFVALDANGTVLGDAIERGAMDPCTALYLWPTSPARNEVGMNTTRLSGVDGTNPQELSESLSTLTAQINRCIDFCQKNIPGFADARLAGIAPRVGVRETRRVVGEYVLTEEDVVEGKKSDRGVAKGGHHVDIHGEGTAQVRRAVNDGRSYDIPYEALVPKNIKNVLMAGRCLSSTREANGSARVMGTCMATGEAVGVAAAMMVEAGLRDVREVDVATLRSRLTADGAVVDGTN